MDVGNGIDVIYSGESYSSSKSKSPARSGRKAVGAETTTAKRRGSLDPELRHEMFGLSYESVYSSRRSRRSHSHSFDSSDKHDDAFHCDDVDDSLRSHRSRSNPSDSAIAVSIDKLRKRSRIVMRYNLALRTSCACLPGLI